MLQQLVPCNYNLRWLHTHHRSYLRGMQLQIPPSSSSHKPPSVLSPDNLNSNAAFPPFIHPTGRLIDDLQEDLKTSFRPLVDVNRLVDIIFILPIKDSHETLDGLFVFLMSAGRDDAAEERGHGHASQ